MNNEQFEIHIKETINPDLYIEPVEHQEDLDRVMLANTPKGNLYICGIPRKGLREEVDQQYRSKFDQPFPSQSMIKAKINSFIEQLPNNLELYE